jgi:hypothetical protein
MIDWLVRHFALSFLILMGILIVSVLFPSRVSTTGDEGPRTATIGNLATLNNAVDLYRVHHHGLLPSATLFEQQMTQCTSDTGEPSQVRDAAHPHGPYLRTVPLQWVGPNKSSTVNGDGCGWLYDPATGKVTANCDPELLKPPR